VARRGARPRKTRHVRVVGSLVVAFVAGSIPFSNIAARRTRGLDLRTVGSGTVSGSSLYRAGAGFVPLAVSGVFEVAKGSVGPLLAGDRPTLAAMAGGAAVAGHNWSPFLRGAGGRGLSPAIGALLVNAWPGAGLLLVGLLIGWQCNAAGFGSFVAVVALAPTLAALVGAEGWLIGGAVAVPVLVKRALGNVPPPERTPPAYLNRIVFDRDVPASR
jgi:glycerol-3-phosphate acyltransferase PlsY